MSMNHEIRIKALERKVAALEQERSVSAVATTVIPKAVDICKELRALEPREEHQWQTDTLPAGTGPKDPVYSIKHRGRGNWRVLGPGFESHNMTREKAEEVAATLQRERDNGPSAA